MKTENMVPKKEWKQKKWQKIVTAVGILGFALFLMLAYANSEIKYIQEQGEENAEELFLMMNEGSVLPWYSSDNKVVAVIECPGKETLFLSKSDKIGSSVIGCTYHLAKDIGVIFASEIFKPDGLLKFEPVLKTE